MTHPGEAAAGAAHQRPETGGPENAGPGGGRSRVAGPAATAATAGAADAVSGPAPDENKGLRGTGMITALFLAPALLVLAVLVVYPIIYTAIRSLFDKDGEFVALDNYAEMFEFTIDSDSLMTLLWLAVISAVVTAIAMALSVRSGRTTWSAAIKWIVGVPLAVFLLVSVFLVQSDSSTFTAIKNNVIWVIVAPTVVTALGLVFAVLTERVKWSTAFKVVVFMPMAISFLAAGVTFKMVYDQDPDIGVANAVAVTVHDTFVEPAPYPGARSRPPAAKMDGPGAAVVKNKDGSFQTRNAIVAGQPAYIPLVAVKDEQLPPDAEDADPEVPDRGLSGVVWRDFQKGGAKTLGGIDPGEMGLGGLQVEAIQNGKVVGKDVTDSAGRFSFPDLEDGAYTVRLPADNFAAPYAGVKWLGPSLVTPSIIGSYIWIWAGFAMVLIAAGLAAIPRDALEAARVDGATEWQVFRRVTIPLVRPVLVVVFVTLMINVLKIFDLVFVIPPNPSDATVIAYEMWAVSFGGSRDEGLGSALAMLLFLVVLPAMLFNVRRFRKEQS
ncbi:MAG: ABC transporter permease subunit [Micromonosporaceae bacterium]